MSSTERERSYYVVLCYPNGKEKKTLGLSKMVLQTTTVQFKGWTSAGFNSILQRKHQGFNTNILLYRSKPSTKSFINSVNEIQSMMLIIKYPSYSHYPFSKQSSC